jgi:hypothetical protein
VIVELLAVALVLSAAAAVITVQVRRRSRAMAAGLVVPGSAAGDPQRIT